MDTNRIVHIHSVIILRRSDKRKDRVEISPEQLSAASTEAEISFHKRYILKIYSFDLCKTIFWWGYIGLFFCFAPFCNTNIALTKKFALYSLRTCAMVATCCFGKYHGISQSGEQCKYIQYRGIH